MRLTIPVRRRGGRRSFLGLRGLPRRNCGRGWCIPTRRCCDGRDAPAADGRAGSWCNRTKTRPSPYAYPRTLDLDPRPLFPGPLAAGEPAVRVLAPGFTVRPLPVHLTNVNNLAIAPTAGSTPSATTAGSTVLRDTDGDGLEDRAELFWERALDPGTPMAAGLVARKGLYVVVARQGLAAARRRQATARRTGRTSSPRAGPRPTCSSGGVDALGVALDAGRQRLLRPAARADYTNAYLVTRTASATLRPQGRARHDPQACRPTSSRARSSATGIRFPVAPARSTARRPVLHRPGGRRRGCPTATRSTS